MAFHFTKGYEDYAKFPMHYLKITQSYNEGNHKAHWYGATPKDYPTDLGGEDGGRDYLISPIDMKVTNVQGIGNSKVSNKVFLVSTKKVHTPIGYYQIFMTAVHFEDSDVKKFGIKKGKVFKAGEPICLEGKETATANHLHFTCGIGSANKSVKNSKGKYVTKGDCRKPEDIFYIDKNFTKVLKTRNIKFQYLPPLKKETKPSVSYYKKYTGKSVSIVDGLKAIGVDSSFSYRKKIAKKNGITAYVGLPSQNKKMLDLLKKGILIKI